MKTKHINHALIALFLFAAMFASSQISQTTALTIAATSLIQSPPAILELGQR